MCQYQLIAAKFVLGLLQMTSATEMGWNGTMKRRSPIFEWRRRIALKEDVRVINWKDAKFVPSLNRQSVPD
jgi:hypothetical protein